MTTLADAALRLPWHETTSGADGRVAVLAPPGSRPEVAVFDADGRRIVGRARLDECREVVIPI